MSRTKISHLMFLFLVLAFILISSKIFNGYGMSIINQITIFIILAVSYNLINGVTGQSSLEPNGFVAAGAYAAALVFLSTEVKGEQFFYNGTSPLILALHFPNFIATLLVAGLCACLLSFTLSFAVSRVRGDCLAIVTLGLGIIIKLLTLSFPIFTDGSRGINEIPVYSNICWAGDIAIIVVMSILNIVYSRYGRAMKAIRDDEDAVSAMGINTFWIKTLAFGTSAFLRSAGGRPLVCLLTTVPPEQSDFLLTFQLLIIVVLGGLGSTTGAVLGSVLAIGGAERLRFLDELKIQMDLFGAEIQTGHGLRMVVFSLILILVMLFARRGIMGDKKLAEIFEAFQKRFRRSEK